MSTKKSSRISEMVRVYESLIATGNLRLHVPTTANTSETHNATGEDIDYYTIDESTSSTSSGNIYSDFQSDSEYGYNTSEPIYEEINTPAQCVAKEPSPTASSSRHGGYSTLKENNLKEIINKFIQNEKDYVFHLSILTEKYMPYFTNSTFGELELQKWTIFRNITDIYAGHVILLEQLLFCGQSLEGILIVLITNAPLFNFYEIFYESTSKAEKCTVSKACEKIIMNINIYLNVNLVDMLHYPLKQLVKYKDFLKECQSVVSIENSLKDDFNVALSIVQDTIKNTVNVITIDTIDNSPISLRPHLPIIEKFDIIILKPKKYPAKMFVFNSIIIIAAKTKEKRFRYKFDIAMSDFKVWGTNEANRIILSGKFGKLLVEVQYASDLDRIVLLEKRNSTNYST